MEVEATEDNRGRTSYLDLLVTTLTEQEKTLSALVDKLEKIANKLSNIQVSTKTESREVEIQFGENIIEIFNRLPEGYQFVIQRFGHKVVIEITKTKAEEKGWEKKLKDAGGEQRERPF